MKHNMQNNINKHTAKMYLIRGKTIFLCFLVFFGISSADIFIKKWMESYEEHFDPNGWCEASVHLPYKIYLEYKDLYDFSNILFLHESSFYTPSYKNVDEIFENNMYSNNNIDENEFVSSTPALCYKSATKELIVNTRFVNYRINEKGEYINKDKIQIFIWLQVYMRS